MLQTTAFSSASLLGKTLLDIRKHAQFKLQHLETLGSLKKKKERNKNKTVFACALRKNKNMHTWLNPSLNLKVFVALGTSAITEITELSQIKTCFTRRLKGTENKKGRRQEHYAKRLVQIGEKKKERKK